MYRSTVVAALFFSSALSQTVDFASISPAPERPARFIVTLRETGGKPDFLDNPSVTKLDLIKGYVVNADKMTAAQLRANPSVKSVEEDIQVTVNLDLRGGWRKPKQPVVEPPPSDLVHVTQTDATWGLARLSTVDKLSDQNANSLTFEYKYATQAGEGVDVYVVDTGVRTTHEQFGDRATWGATFGGYADVDGHGHGTHCAGTVAGLHYGVAKAANIIAVKVLSDTGAGYLSDVLAGLNYVSEQHAANNHASVVSMSLGSPPSDAVDAAVNGLIAAGVHVVVAAGNSDIDVSEYSPARVANAITVGASDITDTKAFFSNYGKGVDLFAPGVNIASAWSTSDNSTLSISGTSMAAPHVSGLLAYLISIEGNKTPAEMSTRVVGLALSKKLQAIPRRTPNRLAHTI